MLEGESGKPVLTVADAITHYLHDRTDKLEAKTLKTYGAQAEAPRKQYVTDDEMAALVLATQPGFGLLIQFLYLTGVRIKDAIALPLTAASEDGIRWEEDETRRTRWVEWSDTLKSVGACTQALRRGQRDVPRSAPQESLEHA